MEGMGSVKEEGRKQRERDQISQTDEQLSIWTTLQQHRSTRHYPALSPGDPGARLQLGALAPTKPKATPPTQLAQDTQTGQLSLARKHADSKCMSHSLRTQTSLAEALYNSP